uniref:Uncharacterized protein n=1 Tax=Arundo donax TaxID=35708 RepID=A0A0A9FLM7_ARUDO
MAPKLLLLDPDRVTRPKLEFFASLGLPAAVLTHSNVLERSLNKHIVPCIEFLRGILGSDACIRSAASRNPCVFRCDPEKIMRPAVEALRHHGLTKEAISKLVVRQVGVLAMAPGRIACIFEDLEELGLPITDPRFFEALCAMCSLSREKWLRKVSVYQSFGVPADVVLKAFKARPRIMSISEGNIKKKLRFFVDELKLDPNDAMGRARVIVLSLEKNILPRCAVLSVLMGEGKIGRDTKLLTSLI